jgi:hypothetical protein
MENSLLGRIADVVGKSAPVLGSVLGSPLAGVGVAMLANTFGGSNKDLQGILDNMLANPEAVQKLKELELAHIEVLAKISSDDYKTEVDDRKDARQREMTLHDYVPTILAVGFLFNYAAIQFYCVIDNNPSNDIISARFQDVLIMIISYYFGSAHKGNASRV